MIEDLRGTGYGGGTDAPRRRKGADEKPDVPKCPVLKCTSSDLLRRGTARSLPPGLLLARPFTAHGCERNQSEIPVGSVWVCINEAANRLKNLFRRCRIR